MNPVIRLELKKFLNFQNIIMGLLLLTVVLVHMYAKASATSIILDNGEPYTGIKSWKIISEQGKRYNGYLTYDHLKEIKKIYDNSSYKPYIEGEKRIPQSMRTYMLTYPTTSLATSLKQVLEDPNRVHESLEISQTEFDCYYDKRPKSAGEIAKGFPVFLKPIYLSKDPAAALQAKAEKMKVPLYYEYNEGWEHLISNIHSYFFLFLIYIIFLFSRSLSLNSDFGICEIELYTKEGRKKLFFYKVRAAEIYTAVSYSIYVGVIFLFCYFIYGLDGANSAIEFNVSRAVFDITVGEAAFASLLTGLFASLMICNLVIFVSGIIKEWKTCTVLISVLIYYIDISYLKRDLLTKRLLYFTPQSTIWGSFRTELASVIDPFIIPLAVWSIILSIFYIVVMRLLSYFIMEKYSVKRRKFL